jgi:hypothetical protein
LVLLFLYHRLYLTAKRQLDSLKRFDYSTLERLTAEREDVTQELCEAIDDLTDEAGTETVSEPVRRRIHQLTSETLQIDAEMKDLLLEDLKEKTLELDQMQSLEIE